MGTVTNEDLLHIALEDRWIKTFTAYKTFIDLYERAIVCGVNHDTTDLGTIRKSNDKFTEMMEVLGFA